MKARTDCTACRKRIYKEAETAYLKHEYKFFEESSYSIACLVATVVLSVMVRRGRSKLYIQQLWKEMCDIFSMPAIFGKEVRMTDVMKQLEADYGIDFKKLELKLESESEFIYQTLHNKEG